MLTKKLLDGVEDMHMGRQRIRNKNKKTNEGFLWRRLKK